MQAETKVVPIKASVRRVDLRGNNRLRELTPAERAKLRAAAPILEKLSQS